MQSSQPLGVRSVLWWAAYTVCGIWATVLLPGVDFLLPGVFCSLQEGNKVQTAWLLVLFVLIHEGLSLLSFGPTMLWYAMACALYYFGQWLFEAENIIFIFLLSAGLGAWYICLGIMMHHLQDVEILMSRLIVTGCLNALVLPPVWFIVHFFRERELRHVNAS